RCTDNLPVIATLPFVSAVFLNSIRFQIYRRRANFQRLSLIASALASPIYPLRSNKFTGSQVVMDSFIILSRTSGYCANLTEVLSPNLGIFNAMIASLAG